MHRLSVFLAAAIFLAACVPARATVFATVHGVVHDPSTAPSPARRSPSSRGLRLHTHRKTDAEGEFDLQQAPIGIYHLQIGAPGFATVTETLTIASGTNAVVHVALPVASATESVEVQGATAQVDSVTPTTLVTRAMIEETPAPAAPLRSPPSPTTCRRLHVPRHAARARRPPDSWLIDGVNIPNTSIASNVGPQISPADTDQIEVQRGSLTADIGDRTYGSLTSRPAMALNGDREAELHITGGTFIPAKLHSPRVTTHRRPHGTPAWPRLAPTMASKHRLRLSIMTPPIRKAASARFW